MKLVLSVFILGISVISFQSCQKCQRCTTTSTQNSTGTNQSSSTYEDFCGENYDEAPTETSYTQNSGGVAYEISIECVEQ